MTNPRCFSLLGLALLLVGTFGCQSGEDSPVSDILFSQIDGQGYKGSHVDFDTSSPTGEYYECRYEVWQTWEFSANEGIESSICDTLCLTKHGQGVCQEYWYDLRMFKVLHDGVDFEEGPELLVFFGDGQSAEFESIDQGTVNPDGIVIRKDSSDNSDTVDGYDDAIEIEEAPAVLDNAWIAAFFAENPPLPEPDGYDDLP